jgi:hypothetical protein
MAEAVTKLVIAKVMAAGLATVVARVFISNADLRHAASKVALEAASASPLT